MFSSVDFWTEKTKEREREREREKEREERERERRLIQEKGRVKKGERENG